MNWFFLQIGNPPVINTDSIINAQRAAANNSTSMNLMDMLTNGGPIMIPLALLFIMAVFFFFERLIAIRKASNIDTNFMNIIRDNLFYWLFSAA